jgi:hypothetical protein
MLNEKRSKLLMEINGGIWGVSYFKLDLVISGGIYIVI